MVRFLLGRSGSGKTHRVLEEISNAAKQGKSGMILLVPEQQSHVMERKLCEHAGNRISLNAESATFRSLCRRVAAQAGGLSKTLLDEGARIVHLYRAVNSARSGFKVLKTAAARPEFLDTLLMLIDRIKACGMTPEQLMESTGKFTGALRDKLVDVAAVYAAYQAQISCARTDPMGQLQKLEEDLRTSGFFRGKHVWIDGFSGFTGIEYKILRLIFSQAECVTVSLCADTQDYSAAFSKGNETFLRLQAMAPNAQVEVLRENLRAGKPHIAHLEKYLFSPDKQVFDGEGAPEMWECANIYAECEFAASRVLELVREHGYRFRDISVSMRNTEDYADTLEAVFSYYRVPLYMSRKSPVLEKAPVAVAVNALKCVCGGFRYDDMLRYIKNGMCGLNRRASDILEDYISIWHMQGSEWSRDAGFIKHPSGYGCAEDEYSRKKLALINRMRDKVRRPLMNLKNAMKADPTGEGCAKAVYEFLGDIRLAQRLEKRAAAFRKKGDVQRAEEYASLWDVLCGAINSIGHVLGDERFEAEEFCRLLVMVLGKYSVGTIPAAIDRVSVGDLSRPGILGDVRCQIVLGANDGTMPMSVGDAALFTENEFREMEDAGIELGANAAARLEEEFRLIYTGMTAASENLLITRPLTLPSGESGRESFVCQRIRELFSTAHTKSAGAEVHGAAPAPCFDAVAQGGAEWQGAREWFSQSEEWSGKLALAERGSRVPRGPINEKENIRKIFGGEIYLSASRADVFASCRYRYFLQYGLKLRPREVARLDPAAAGTLIHDVLEKTMKRVDELGGTRSVTPEQVESIARAAGDAYARERMGGLDGQTARFRFLFGRLCGIAVQVAKDVCAELNTSGFKPIAYELPVSDAPGGIPAVRMCENGTTLRLEGYIDRVDAMDAPDNRLYIRVVDYKTGKKDFSMDEVLNGINLQLLVYLFAIKKQGQQLFGREVLPAGVLYVPARDPEIPGDGTETDEELWSKRESVLRRKGVLLDDPHMLREMEQGMQGTARFLPIKFNKGGELSGNSSVISAENLTKLEGHIDETLKGIAHALSVGDVCANPYYTGRAETVCSFCPYKDACMFDEAAGDRGRRLGEINSKDFFKSGEEAENNGD